MVLVICKKYACSFGIFEVLMLGNDFVDLTWKTP
jgi:hypothetical protein